MRRTITWTTANVKLFDVNLREKIFICLVMSNGMNFITGISKIWQNLWLT